MQLPLIGGCNIHAKRGLSMRHLLLNAAFWSVVLILCLGALAFALH